MVTLEAPVGIVTFSQPRYLPEPSGAQTLPSTLPLKLAPGLFIATVIFISLPAVSAAGVKVTFAMEALPDGIGAFVSNNPALGPRGPLWHLKHQPLLVVGGKVDGLALRLPWHPVQASGAEALPT